ncbi:MAG: type II secretion system protein [Candidatus Pacebacteria bacterium]|nr:type II secretion system protein [Candidatus Paceibacterota bacterium]
MVKKHNKQSGVTLIELIVVIGIFAVVSSVLLFNYSDFSTNVSIRNLSQDIALSIRKSQTFATSVRGISPGGTAQYPAYGIVFSLEPNIDTFSPNSKRFISFADIIPSGQSTPNKKYDSNGTCGSPSEGAECIESISINSSDSIIEIETDVLGSQTTGSVVITFRRPSPDAIICLIPSSQDVCTTQIPSYAKIKLRSAKGLIRTVSVWNTGQINVE